MQGIEAPLGLEREYAKELLGLLRTLFAAIRADVLPVVEQELKTQRAQFKDAVDGSLFDQLYSLATALLRGKARSMVNRILNLGNQKHQKSFMATAKKALGIDLSAVVREEDTANVLEIVATNNAGLIKNLMDSMIQKVQLRVTNAVLTGKSADTLRKELMQELGFANNRARIIARDQISKLNASLTEFRHKQAGIFEYDWSTSHDERVRPLHRHLDGNRYKYDEPTGAEQGLPPGQPILCRCVGRPVITF